LQNEKLKNRLTVVGYDNVVLESCIIRRLICSKTKKVNEER